MKMTTIALNCDLIDDAAYCEQDEIPDETTAQVESATDEGTTGPAPVGTDGLKSRNS